MLVSVVLDVLLVDVEVPPQYQQCPAAKSNEGRASCIRIHSFSRTAVGPVPAKALEMEAVVVEVPVA